VEIQYEINLIFSSDQAMFLPAPAGVVAIIKDTVYLGMIFLVSVLHQHWTATNDTHSNNTPCLPSYLFISCFTSFSQIFYICV